jgi:hypothetical protein
MHGSATPSFKSGASPAGPGAQGPELGVRGLNFCWVRGHNVSWGPGVRLSQGGHGPDCLLGVRA